MSEISTIIFSKNRASQLDLLLRGVTFPASVLYTCYEDFEGGYRKVISMHPNVEFVREVNFKEQLLSLMKDTDYTMFMADDDVLIEPFEEDCPEFKEFKSNEQIVSLSLSLCPRYRYDGLPVLVNNKWEWTPYKGRAMGYSLRIWGFPMGLIGHVFRKADIFPAISKGSIAIPNHIEGTLTANIPQRPLMMCFDEPKVINIQANQVQKVFPDKNYGVSICKLEKRFMRGERLSLDDIKQKAKNARSYHLVTNYEYEHDTRQISG